MKVFRFGIWLQKFLRQHQGRNLRTSRNKHKVPFAMAPSSLLFLVFLCLPPACSAQFDIKGWFKEMDHGNKYSRKLSKRQCGDYDGSRCLMAFSFTGLDVPEGEEQSQPQFAEDITISGRDTGSTPYQILILEGENWRSNNAYDGDTFGVIKSRTGQVLSDVRAGGSLFTGQSNMPDFFSLMYTGISGKVHGIAHLENIPASTQLLEMDQDPDTGKLTVTRSTTMDWTSYGGLHAPCAGSLSPWNTHMGSEEWGPPDARAMEACTECDCASSYARYMLGYFDVPVECTDFAAWKAQYDEHYSPYMYNFAWESGIDGVGTKHMAMGRRGTELPYVMPDEKTVYLTDDAYGGALSVFVADTARDLSAGTLYCAVMEQVGDDSVVDGGSFTVREWKDMGHATTKDIQDVVLASPKPVFSDMFETADPVNNACPTGFTSINAGNVGHECLRVKAGQDKLASRLETRRYAAMLGCTSEFSRQEGVTFSMDTGKLYMAMTSVRKNMLADDAGDVGGPDVMRLRENRCGCVYEFDVNPENYLVTTMQGLVCGAASTNDDPQNSCDIDGISNPDNVAALHGHKMLLIAEDTRGHYNNIMWLYDLEQKQLVGRIGATPEGAEVCSPYFYPDVGGFSYITMVMQHPNSTSFGPSGIGYVAWKRDCSVEYPLFAMPGHGAQTRCEDHPENALELPPSKLCTLVGGWGNVPYPSGVYFF